ncbi:DUF1353 domain-containing protein [Cerasicoccus frondis]|uniref:DUF1353 domain-containing protein n=1 Tax=Cerasicoccus frondis TaxID=490090 RepID=UPI002852803D|nr:DUF1353 domain-containing protein [Cerasicoccus frondis]
MRSKTKLLSGLIIAFLSTAGITHADDGQFIGRVAVVWIIGDGSHRDMQLLEDFQYIDPDGKSWFVPKGTIVDGASIPRALWSIVGPPFVGRYRQASVVHDYYCDKKNESWEDVHRMFYNACLSARVNILKAKSMYAAVWSRGPRWEIINFKGLMEEMAPVEIMIQTSIEDEQLKSIQHWIESENPPLEDIEKRVDAFVQVEQILQ